AAAHQRVTRRSIRIPIATSITPVLVAMNNLKLSGIQSGIIATVSSRIQKCIDPKTVQSIARSQMLRRPKNVELVSDMGCTGVIAGSPYHNPARNLRSNSRFSGRSRLGSLALHTLVVMHLNPLGAAAAGLRQPEHAEHGAAERESDRNQQRHL